MMLLKAFFKCLNRFNWCVSSHICGSVDGVIRLVPDNTVHLIHNRYWSEVYQNLPKSRRRWGMVARVLENTGAIVWAQVEIYKAVTQSLLL